MQYRVVIEEAEEGGYVVTCPALPGCITQGETHEEALENMRDAIKGYLESYRMAGDPLPSVSEEILDVEA